MRSGRWSASANIRIEIMCEHERSLELAGLLNAKYDRDDGLLIFSHPVDVLN